MFSEPGLSCCHSERFFGGHLQKRRRGRAVARHLGRGDEDRAEILRRGDGQGTDDALCSEGYLENEAFRFRH